MQGLGKKHCMLRTKTANKHILYARRLSDAISTLRFQLATSFCSSNICAFWLT